MPWQIWTLVVPKSETVPDLFTLEEVEELLNNGAPRLKFASHDISKQELVITAIGAFQLEQVLKASAPLKERDLAHSVIYMLEPGRFRIPRSKGERTHIASEEIRRELYPDSASARIFVTHPRPEPLLGMLQSLHIGRNKTAGLVFIGQGGTLNLSGMLFVHRSTWGHILLEVARVLELPREKLLNSKDLSVLDGKKSPEGVII